MVECSEDVWWVRGGLCADHLGAGAGHAEGVWDSERDRGGGVWDRGGVAVLGEEVEARAAVGFQDFLSLGRLD